MSYAVGGIIGVVLLLLGAFWLGQKSYEHKIRALGSLHILIDDIDGSRYPLVELNNDHDLWELKTGDVAIFVVKHVDQQ